MLDFYSFECLNYSNITFGIFHANSIDFNIRSQYNVKWNFWFNRTTQKQRVNKQDGTRRTRRWIHKRGWHIKQLSVFKDLLFETFYFVLYSDEDCMKSYISKGTPRRIDVDFTWILVGIWRPMDVYMKSGLHVNVRWTSKGRLMPTGILRRYVEDQISTNLHIICTYFFDVISLIKKSTSFPHTFFDVISMVQKSTSFPHTFFSVISMVKKSLLFSLIFFDVILMVEKSMLFACIFSTRFWRAEIRRRF